VFSVVFYRPLFVIVSFSFWARRASWKLLFDSCIYIKLYINVCIPEMQSVSIDTKVANLILNPEKVYSIQHYVIRLDSMFWQVVALIYVQCI
jgi:hypothetical protein